MKLHGSIDWILGDEGDVWRVRDTDIYPRRSGSVLIYPQSTKYVATQRRSEEHTSELQSLMRISYAVFCLKKKNATNINTPTSYTHCTPTENTTTNKKH